MKIAIAQLNPLIGDISGNARRILDSVEKAAAAGARLVLTPELSLCGYPPRDLLLSPAFIKTLESTVVQMAATLPRGVVVLGGTVDRNLEGTRLGEKPLFNSMALLEQGKPVRFFHKRLLPTYDVFDEDRYFASGQDANVLELDGLRIGVTVCEDLWNEESFWGHRQYSVEPVADLVAQSVDMVVNLSASPFCVGKQAIREAMLSHTAQRYGVPILYVNQVGGNDDLVFDGRSFAVNPQGIVMGRALAFAEDLFWVEVLPVEASLEMQAKLAPNPPTPSAEIWGALVLGVRDYVRKCGFGQVVLGLSGGIDSALVAAIVAEALGAEQVLGVLMPSPYSSDHSVTDALALAQNLGISTQLLPIGPLMEGFDQALGPLFAGTAFGVAEENIQARIRGNLLMAIANKFSRLLISTGNKSEVAVGYCTLYGDMSGGLAAIADVPKTRVYEICAWLNSAEARPWLQRLVPQSGTVTSTESLELIPTAILSKAPSAELKPGQVDQDSLPPYPVLDDILYRYIDQHQTLAEIIASGHDAATVQRILQLVKRAEFKRQQAAPGLKITDRAFGTGWRMPIAAQWEPEPS